MPLVSSTGHMIIVDDMWLKSVEFLESKFVANTFKIVIQLGSILAVVIVFKDRFIDMLGLNRWLNKKAYQQHSQQSQLKLTQVIVGLLPARDFRRSL